MGEFCCSPVKQLTLDSSQRSIPLFTLISSLVFLLAGKVYLGEWSLVLPRSSRGTPGSGEVGFMLIPQTICTVETGTWACGASWTPI